MAIRVEVHHYHHGVESNGELQLIASLLSKIQESMMSNADVISRLTQEVAEMKGAQESAIVLITGFREALAAAVASNDLAAAQSLIDQIDASTNALAAAVTANALPAAPAPVPPVVDPVTPPPADPQPNPPVDAPGDPVPADPVPADPTTPVDPTAPV